MRIKNIIIIMVIITVIIIIMILALHVASLWNRGKKDWVLTSKVKSISLIDSLISKQSEIQNLLNFWKERKGLAATRLTSFRSFFGSSQEVFYFCEAAKICLTRNKIAKYTFGLTF